MLEDNNIAIILELWRLRCLRSSRLFYIASERFYAAEKRLTLINLVSSILVLFFSLGHSLAGIDGKWVDFIVALSSAIVVITSVCQYYLGYGRMGVEYSEAGARYAAMNRNIERIIGGEPGNNEITTIQRQLDELGRTTPVFSRNIWKQAKDINSKIEKLENEHLSSITLGVQ